jgi:uridine kinase
MHIIGVTGLSCSGKTTLSEKLYRRLGTENCLLISMDNYYKELTSDQYKVLHNDEAAINFDTPDAINFEMLKKNLKDIKNNVGEVKLPIFDLASCTLTGWKNVPSNKYKYIIIEGLLIFSDPEVVELCNLKIWVDASDYVCALRRFIKFTDTIKGYSHQYIYNQCVKFVIPGQDKYVKPVKNVCDFFINGEKNDINHVEIIVKYVANSVDSNEPRCI